jgi:two-component system CheB/CheR fusion protein
MRIFVVENHANTLKYFHLYLESEGHTVFEARTMQEALDAIPGANCDVLISDIGLPDGKGWDLLSRLRAEGLPHPPYAVAISGYGTPEDRARSSEAGFRHHLLKPFSPDKLDAVLKEAARERASSS